MRNMSNRAVPRKRSPKLALAWLAAASISACPLQGWSQVYKWVDEQGRTHYGQSKPRAEQASAAELRVQRAPQPPARATAPAKPPDAMAAQRSPALHGSAQGAAGTAPQPARSRSGGREDGSDASRCALAQDVLSGAVRHGNGKPTDQYDIDVANNDVRMFCR